MVVNSRLSPAWMALGGFLRRISTMYPRHRPIDRLKELWWVGDRRRGMTNQMIWRLVALCGLVFVACSSGEAEVSTGLGATSGVAIEAADASDDTADSIADASGPVELVQPVELVPATTIPPIPSTTIVPTGPSVEILTADAPTPLSQQALNEINLRHDPELNCLYFDSPDNNGEPGTGGRNVVIWPFGYTAVLDGEDVVVLNEFGAIVAQTNMRVTLVGGTGGPLPDHCGAIGVWRAGAAAQTGLTLTPQVVSPGDEVAIEGENLGGWFELEISTTDGWQPTVAALVVEEVNGTAFTVPLGENVNTDSVGFEGPVTIVIPDDEAEGFHRVCLFGDFSRCGDLLIE